MFFLDPLRETLDWIDSVKMEQICKQVLLSSNLEVFKELLDPLLQVVVRIFLFFKGVVQFWRI